MARRRSLSIDNVVESHYENNDDGALRRLNAIAEQESDRPSGAEAHAVMSKRPLTP